MKAGIEAFSLQKSNTGIGNYTYQLLRSLSEISANEDFTSHIYINEAKSGCTDFCPIQNIKSFSLDGRFKEILYRTLLMGGYINRTDIDIYHGTAFYLPMGLRKRSVITVHDLACYKYANTFESMKVLYARLCIPDSLKRADRIIAVSENTKRDLIDIFGVKEDRIKVIYEAADRNYEVCSPEKVEEVKTKYGINKYILCVGTLEPRKNLVSLLKAYARIINLLPEACRLVITGRKGWLYDEILKTAGDLGDKVIFTGYVTNEELMLLYNGASVFVYPSLYEGFGLPVIEAMACGTPVITSNSSSLPEVVGAAGIMTDPLSIGELSDAILNVVSNDELRNKLSKKSLERAGLFSWDKAARQTLEVYRELC